MAETKKAYNRRKRSGFFIKYCKGHGIDIGCGDDPLQDEMITELVKYDQNQIPDCVIGNAETLSEFPDCSFDFVYSSHCLEHIKDYKNALCNWFRVLKVGGFLILLLPHRDYYECKDELPSKHNPDHKVYFLPFIDEHPCTVSVYNMIREVFQRQAFSIIYLNECCEIVLSKKYPEDFFDKQIVEGNKKITDDREYSIEVVIQKLGGELK